MLGVPQDAWAAGPVSACSSVHVYSAAQAAPHQGDTAGGTAPASELSTAPAPTFSLSTNPTADSTQVWRHIMLHRDHSADRKEYDPESIAREQKVALLLAVSYHSSCSYYWPLFLLLAPTPTTAPTTGSYLWLQLLAPTTAPTPAPTPPQVIVGLLLEFCRLKELGYTPEEVNRSGAGPAQFEVAKVG